METVANPRVEQGRLLLNGVHDPLNVVKQITQPLLSMMVRNHVRPYASLVE